MIIPLARAALRPIGSFLTNVEAVAAVEFAMVLPVMVTIYLGMVEVSTGVSADRKVTLLSRSLADLTAQKKTLTSAQVGNIFDAAAAVLSPYAAADAQMVISSVKVDNEGVAKIAWSCQRNGTAHGANTEIELPDGLAVNNTTLILAEVTYPFTPVIGYVLSGTIELEEKTYMRPRLVTEIPVPVCPA